MLLRHLELQHYRNYAHLDVSFEPGLVVLQGANAQGKTNLLEVMYLLATTRSVRARSDGELISYTDRDPISQFGFARIVARVERAGSINSLEVVIRDVNADGQARKRFKLNGAERRAGEILGKVNAVFFAPSDVDLVDGPPANRRRYLDVMICQVDSQYTRALGQYNRAVMQRNALLRQVREMRQQRQLLEYWDDQLRESGAVVIASRASAVRELAALAAERHQTLSSGEEALTLTYRPALPDVPPLDELAQGGLLAAADCIARGIATLREREIAAGASLVGPHRDDLGFAINGRDAAMFASRGQQRTVTLAMKLAELTFMQTITGESPLLLLDDATSELDERRRAAIFEAAGRAEQTFMTTADEHVGSDVPGATQRWHVENGTLSHLAL